MEEVQKKEKKKVVKTFRQEELLNKNDALFRKLLTLLRGVNEGLIVTKSQSISMITFLRLEKLMRRS